MATRQIRNQTFCWQEKSVLRLIKSKFKGIERVKMLTLYSGLTWIDSDFNGQNIKYYTKTIASYTGLSKNWIPQGLSQLEKLEIIDIKEVREVGKFRTKEIAFTPPKDDVLPPETINGETINGETINGEQVAIRTYSFREHSSLREHSLYKQLPQNQTTNEPTCQDTPPAHIEQGKPCGNLTNEILNLFKKINPSYQRLFSNKTERGAIDRLIATHGLEAIKAIIEKLPDVISRPYAPKITTPYQLERDLGKLKIFIEQQQGIQQDKKGGMAILNTNI